VLGAVVEPVELVLVLLAAEDLLADRDRAGQIVGLARPADVDLLVQNVGGRSPSW
jgi:hypothetical protein